MRQRPCPLPVAVSKGIHTAFNNVPIISRSRVIPQGLCDLVTGEVVPHGATADVETVMADCHGMRCRAIESRIPRMSPLRQKSIRRTFIGWVVALAMVVAGNTPSTQRSRPDAYSPPAPAKVATNPTTTG